MGKFGKNFGRDWDDGGGWLRKQRDQFGDFADRNHDGIPDYLQSATSPSNFRSTGEFGFQRNDFSYNSRLGYSIRDRDGDGRVDFLSFDRDGDGKPDYWICDRDRDGDGKPDHWEYDIDRDGRVDQWGYDKNGDGIPDFWRFDSNGDGKIDGWQRGFDKNRDGRLDCWESDFNGDGKIDQWAFDKDGNGIPDYWEFDNNKDGRVDQWAYDKNGDGIADFWRFDSNGDGKIDSWQRGIDRTRNGRLDCWESDKNGDGQVDQWAYDNDGDGKPDYWLRDTIGDGKGDQWAKETTVDGKSVKWHPLRPHAAFKQGGPKRSLDDQIKDLFKLRLFRNLRGKDLKAAEKAQMKFFSMREYGSLAFTLKEAIGDASLCQDRVTGELKLSSIHKPEAISRLLGKELADKLLDKVGVSQGKLFEIVLGKETAAMLGLVIELEKLQRRIQNEHILGDNTVEAQKKRDQEKLKLLSRLAAVKVVENGWRKGYQLNPVNEADRIRRIYRRFWRAHNRYRYYQNLDYEKGRSR